MSVQNHSSWLANDVIKKFDKDQILGKRVFDSDEDEDADVDEGAMTDDDCSLSSENELGSVVTSDNMASEEDNRFQRLDSPPLSTSHKSIISSSLRRDNMAHESDNTLSEPAGDDFPNTADISLNVASGELLIDTCQSRQQSAAGNEEDFNIDFGSSEVYW